VSPDLEIVRTNFRAIYLDGIPKLIADGTAFLTFVCIIAATEGLCGYRYGAAYAQPNIGKLFKQFLTDYYPAEYAQHTNALWELRNKLVHAFSTGRFLLTHHHSEFHLTETQGGVTPVKTLQPAALPVVLDQPFAWTGAPIDFAKAIRHLSGPVAATGSFIQPTRIILNAEDLYNGLLFAADKYFIELEDSSALQETMSARLSDSKGGAIAVRMIPELS
jgi:hypothetical protein